MTHRILYTCDVCKKESVIAYGFRLLVPQEEAAYFRLAHDLDACSLDCLEVLMRNQICAARGGLERMPCEKMP